MAKYTVHALYGDIVYDTEHPVTSTMGDAENQRKYYGGWIKVLQGALHCEKCGGVHFPSEICVATGQYHDGARRREMELCL